MVEILTILSGTTTKESFYFLMVDPVLRLCLMYSQFNDELCRDGDFIGES